MSTLGEALSQVDQLIADLKTAANVCAALEVERDAALADASAEKLARLEMLKQRDTLRALAKFYLPAGASLTGEERAAVGWPPVACSKCLTPIAKFIEPGGEWHPCRKCEGALCETCCDGVAS